MIGLVVFSLSCSLIPKDVEFFQKRVKELPAKTQTHSEVIKEAAAFVAEKTQESHIQAINENSSTNLKYLTYESSIVANSLSDSIGKPANPWKSDAEKLSLKLDNLEAKLDQKIENFRERNNELKDKSIEGTGLIRMSYISYILLLFGFFSLLWFGLKVLSVFNPGIAVGMRVASVPVSLAQKGLGQVIEGIEAAKERIKKDIKNKKVQETILEIIRTEQEKKQNSDVQSLIREVTKK